MVPIRSMMCQRLPKTEPGLFCFSPASPAPLMKCLRHLRLYIFISEFLPSCLSFMGPCHLGAARQIRKSGADMMRIERLNQNH